MSVCLFLNIQKWLFDRLINGTNKPVHCFKQDKQNVSFFIRHLEVVLNKFGQDKLTTLWNLMERPKEFSKSYLPSLPGDQIGYASLAAFKRNISPENVRNMGPIYSSVLRILIDSVLCLATFKTKQSFSFVDCEDETEYFFEQVLKDLEIISVLTNRSTDETLLLMHYVVDKIMVLACHNKISEQDLFLKTSKSRADFENRFCNEVLSQALKEDIDEIFNTGIELLNIQLKKQNDDVLLRIAYDCDPDYIAQDNQTISSPPEFDLQDLKYWSVRKQINLNHMANVFNLSKLAERYKFLKWFLNEIYQLEAIQFLPKIAKMVEHLNQNYSRAYDHRQAKLTTLDNFAEKSNPIIREGVISFLRALPLIRQKFELISQEGMEIFNIDASQWKSVELIYLLPGDSGKCVFIYTLLEHLINLNNKAIQNYHSFKSSVEQANLTKIRFADLTQFNCVSFELKRDIDKIVLIYANYLFDKNLDMNIDYNYEKIQEAIGNLLFVNKPLIEEKVRSKRLLNSLHMF